MSASGANWQSGLRCHGINLQVPGRLELGVRCGVTRSRSHRIHACHGDS